MAGGSRIFSQLLHKFAERAAHLREFAFAARVWQDSEDITFANAVGGEFDGVKPSRQPPRRDPACGRERDREQRAPGEDGAL